MDLKEKLKGLPQILGGGGAAGAEIVVSFSGGRTSAYLVYVLNELAKEMGLRIRFVFMDTGAEHPLTYAFIRDVVKYWGIDLECIRLVLNPTLRGKNSWERVPVASLRFDLQYMRALVTKLGTFTKGQPHCTRDMKKRTFEKYAKDTIAEDHTVWLGMRFDEPSRLWGRYAYADLRAGGNTPDDCAALWGSCVRGVPPVELPPSAVKRLETTKKERLHYLAEISDFEKVDVLRWWKGQPFDLRIEEHLGNCVFCVKKNAKKIALACRDEPGMMASWRSMHVGPHVRTENLPSRDPAMSASIYVDHVTGRPVTLDHIIAMFTPYSREDLYRQMKFSGGEDTGSCSESCEVFGDDDDPAAGLV